MSAHINAVGEFQSDKYPTCPAGKVPLSTKDPTAQDLLWEYAQRRREVDSEFADDLEVALRSKGYVPKSWVCGTCHATDDRGDICPDCANRMYSSGERDARIATLESAARALVELSKDMRDLGDSFDEWAEYKLAEERLEALLASAATPPQTEAPNTLEDRPPAKEERD